MRSLIYLLVMLLLCAVPSFAGMTMVMSGGAAGDAYDDLLMLLEFEDGSDADQTYTATTGNGDYCVDGDPGAGNDCDTADEGDGALSNLSEKNGSLGFDSPAGADEWRFGVTSNDHFDPNQGTLAFWVYINSFTSGCHTVAITSGPYMTTYIQTGPEFRMKFDDQTADFTATTGYGSFATGNWYFVVNKWDMTLGVDADWMDITVLDSSCSQLTTTNVTNSGGDNVIPWSVTDNDSLRPGGSSGTARDIWLDTISVWNTTTRTAAALCAITTSPK